MRIVFYSTNSSAFNSQIIRNSRYPSCGKDWEDCASVYPEHEFIIVSAEPGTFLISGMSARENENKSGRVKYFILKDEDVSRTAEKIISLSPDVAVAATFWTPPYDWLSVQDALVAEELTRAGIRTVCHPLKTARLCMDKSATHNFLEEHGFSVPRALHVHHGLFWCERGSRSISTNVYKEAVLHELKKMPLPVVIKDCAGLSSYGTELAGTFKEAHHYLKSPRTTGDRIVEEYIDGIQAGLEIYGTPGNYTVLSPFFFSVNRYGITSPKQSIKLGPAQDERFRISFLKEEMVRLAELLKLNGAAQVDLIFKDGAWYVIEINARLSGMTETYAAGCGISVAQMLTCLALGKTNGLSLRNFACNFKLPLMGEEQLRNLSETQGISLVRQIHNTAARQEREKGYCEIIISSGTINGIRQVLKSLKASSAAYLEPVFMRNFNSLAELF